MSEYILLMYNDAQDNSIVNDPDNWSKYLDALYASGQFAEMSAIGGGLCCKKNQADLGAHDRQQDQQQQQIVGSIRIRATNPLAAKQWLVGNPVYEAGGTVEIRALLRD